MTYLPAPDLGVSPPQGGGTPRPLDPADSADALHALEFAAVLEVVAEHAAGEVAAVALRARLPMADAEWIRHELAMVGEVLALLRRGDRLTVEAVPDIASAIARLRVDGSVLEVTELAAVRAALQGARVVTRELERLVESCPTVATRHPGPIDASLLPLLDRSVGDDGELLDSASKALAAARSEIHVARERLVRRLEGMLRDLDPTAVPGGASVTMRSGRYVIPVRRDARGRPDGIIHDESGSAGTLFVEPTAAIPLGNALREAVAAEERAVLAVLRDLTDRLRPHRLEIAAHHAMSVEIDTVVARALWALEVDAEVPELVASGGAVILRGARHPLLLARGVPVVSFDLILEESERTLLISGPNTGGKTVLLKTTGLVHALVQSGIVPPLVKGSSLPVYSRIFADIGDHQSIAADLSTFSAHVASLRHILDRADPATLVLLDEIGSGTDPAEGGALAAAVLSALTRRHAVTLATTHLGSLKTLAEELSGIVNGALEFSEATLSPTFRFTAGIPGRSYGLAIARRLGLDPEVLAAAEALVPRAERALDQLLASVEARARSLEEETASLAGRVMEIERREVANELSVAQLEARETELRHREKSAERERIQQARNYLLEARKRVDEAIALAQGAASEEQAREARRVVEQGVQEQAQLLAETNVSTVPDGVRIGVGSSVRLGTGSSGEVLELRGDGKAVVQVGRVRIVVSVDTLVPASRAERVSQLAASPRSPDVPAPEGDSEIDLRGMRADEAESVVIAALDSAVLAELPELRIIHGMGTGVLRDVVRRTLEGDARVAAFDFAPRPQGGLGVTIVVLR